jgi:tetratricopeptide (TPR) repeat protein
VRLFCSPYQVDTPLHPVTEALARELEFAREDRSTEKLVKIERWLNQLNLDSATNVPILASLLSVRAEGEYRPPRFSPEALREQHLRLLLNMVHAISQRQPLLVLAEDLHWADPTTLIFLERLIELIRDERVLLIVTARPEFLPRWTTQPNVTVLALNHLSARESQIMVEELFGEGEIVSDDVLNQIVQRADGVPLFVEELSRTIAELPAEYPAGSRVPETLRDALTARLDRLQSSVQHIAQLAAVIGRQFPVEWLEAASNASPASLANSIQELVRSGLVLERHSPVGMSYEFKHALVRDSAYESLLRGERERLHARIAQAIENFDHDQQPALIAFHYQAAGAPDRALPYWIRAGGNAQQRDANEEAAVHFRSALDYLEQIGEQSARTLQVVVGGALALHLSGSREAAAALLARHAPLAAKLNDPAPLAKYHIAFGKISSFHGQREVARDNLKRGLKLAESVNDIPMIAEAELDLAIEEIFKVRLISPRTRVERVFALLEGTDYLSELLLAYNIDAYICAHSGHVNAGLALAKKAESLAHSLGHHGLIHPTEIFSWVYRLSGQWKASIEKIEATLADKPAPFSEALLYYYLSLTYLESGQVSTALPMLVESLEKAKRYRSKQVQVWVSASLAEALLRSGDIERAEEIANEAIAMTREIQAATIQADRVAGLIARERGQLERAKELLGGIETHLSAEGFKPDLAKVLIELASVAYIENDPDRVADYLKGAHRLYVEMKLDKFASDVNRQAIRFGIDLAAN